MVYLTIKELAISAEDVIMVTSSIMKDMQPNSEVIYRPNAIRALCRIIDVCLAFSQLTCARLAHPYSLRWYKA
jgi:coatomer subunit gamma